MSRPAGRAVLIGLAAAVLLAAPIATLGAISGRAHAGARQAGTVLAVDAQTRSLTVDVYGENGERRAVRVQVPADARVLQSQRAAAPGDFRGAFREIAISLADVRAGDFVVIEMSTDHPEVARLVMVTLRRGAGS